MYPIVLERAGRKLSHSIDSVLHAQSVWTKHSRTRQTTLATNVILGTRPHAARCRPRDGRRLL
jgi:hypothetical protein